MFMIDLCFLLYIVTRTVTVLTDTQAVLGGPAT